MVVTVIISLVAVYGALSIAADPLCSLAADVQQQLIGVGAEGQQLDDPCSVAGPMSCYTDLCEDLGLTCQVNGECVCPHHAEACNLTMVDPTAFLCDSGNHSFHRL